MACRYDISTDEGFEFAGKHTKEFNLILQNRIADPPDEKEIIESIPFMQGNLDFSSILGQRVFENREIVFEFLIVDYSYQRRKSIEKSLTNWLMGPSHIKLYDDFSEDYYYIAKCKSINYEDRYEGMTVVITFDAHPFMIGDYLEGSDLWDPFNFELDVFQDAKHTINGSSTVTIYNTGSNMISPKIVASADFEIIKGDATYNLSAGTTNSDEFMFGLGENVMTIKGNGTIEFLFRKELL